MTKMVARRMFATSVSNDTDDVIAGLFMPGDTMVSNIRGHVDLHSTILSVNNVVLAAIEGWVLPISDPDAASTMSALWDALVPKDTALDAMDLDSGAADSTPFYEGGSIVWEKVFDVGLQPRRVFHWHDMFSLGRSIAVSQQDVETPFLQEWFAGKSVPIKIHRPIRVKVPSLLVFGIASPLLDQTSATSPIQGLAEEKWFQIKYIDHVTERAMLHLMGLTEAGAETPFVEAATLLRNHLDPAILESDAGTLVGTTWFASGELTFEHHVPGSMPKGTLTGGR